MIDNKVYDILIIGSGPGGLTAAIYAKRAEADIAILEKSAPGGKVVKTSTVENYPGVENIEGPDLAMNMFMQTQNLGVPFIGAEVISVVKKKNIFEVKTKDKVYKAKTVIIGTGTIERKVGAIGEDKYYGKGVSYCAVCDGALYKEKRLAVIGGGYAALEEAMYLTKFASKVFVIHRRQGFRAESNVIKKAQANKKITFILDATLNEVYGDDVVRGLKYEQIIDKKIIDLPDIAAVFPYIGADPIVNFIEDKSILDDNNYIKVNNKCETTIKGLYAIGDVTNTPLRQIATAVSDGAKAAQFAIEYLDKM
ncbi:NAD(P)/FAD-dependent oxidoreductase [Spiroplasma endosymbiont of Amphibalanus improvisus]|uniref:NAD(P)/FAD-dependent oxidoreductase n=1 Tax=Spiroplasma endosymbiont of Amphibalanus improvisus TaxID=3066327 RepID=UPI00313BC000